MKGAPLSTRVDDSEDYTLEVLERLRRRDAHGQETRLLKVSVASGVARRAIAPVVRFAVDLDR